MGLRSGSRNLKGLLLLALPGAYAAMVLVIGAKGLVRWSDLSGDGQRGP